MDGRLKYTLIRLSRSKRWHIARVDKHTVCGKRIYTVDWYSRGQTPADGEKVCADCDAKKDDEPKMIAGAGYAY